MSRESAAEKANRLLVERRVVVVEVRPGYSRAIVRGDSGLHEVIEDSNGRACTCVAARTCSHLLAVGMVTPPVVTAPGLHLSHPSITHARPVPDGRLS